MRLLIDTHAFLWWATGNGKLSRAARDAIDSESNDLFISAIVGWEIAIKASNGALILPRPTSELLSRPIVRGDAAELPIRLAHSLRVEYLPKHHKDPFDRLLVAQSIVENLTILTADPLIQQYGVPTHW